MHTQMLDKRKICVLKGRFILLLLSGYKQMLGPYLGTSVSSSASVTWLLVG
jgi:hypothetical protein